MLLFVHCPDTQATSPPLPLLTATNTAHHLQQLRSVCLDLKDHHFPPLSLLALAVATGRSIFHVCYFTLYVSSYLFYSSYIRNS